MKSNIDSDWLALYGTIITALAGIVGALIANWDKIAEWRRRRTERVKPENSTIPDFDRRSAASIQPTGEAETIPGKRAQYQLLLRSAGYTVFVDGFIGPQTTKAVIDFQKQKGLAVTGLFDGATRAALLEVGETFKTIQRRLINLGYAVGVDGFCGRDSTAALKDLQANHGLEVSGLADSATRRLLEQLAGS